MPDLVLVPSYYRPEYLYLTLEHLAKADDGKDKIVHVAQDKKKWDAMGLKMFLPEIREVVQQFKSRFRDLRYTERNEHSNVGNVLNFLELYREAYYNLTIRYVYMVEDDVLVAPDFFRWHEAVQERADYFCTVGWHCIRNPQVKASTDATALIESGVDFSSIGVCWDRRKLREVVEHACAEYYSDLSGYLRRRFVRDLRIQDGWTEQAGLIMRILLRTPSHTVAWAAQRRCSHVGINGYHRTSGYKFHGTLEQKVANLRQAAKKTETLVNLSRDPFDDIQAPEEIKPWTPEQLHVVQRF